MSAVEENQALVTALFAELQECKKRENDARTVYEALRGETTKAKVMLDEACDHQWVNLGFKGLVETERCTQCGLENSIWWSHW